MPIMKPKKSSKVFKCSECPKEYKSVRFFRRHQQSHGIDDSDEDLESHAEQPTQKYYCVFCDTKFPTAKSFNLHYGQCLRNYDACQKSSSSSRSSNAAKPYVCSVCQKSFTRLGTYKCHLSCHENRQKKSIKSVIRAVCPKDPTCAALTQPNLSKLPRIPRLSERNKLHPDHTFSKPPDAEPSVDEGVSKEPATSSEHLAEPIRLMVTLNDDKVVISEMPKLVIQDVRHVDRVVADLTKGLSMPCLEDEVMRPDTTDLDDVQQLLEDMFESDEDDPSQAVSSSREIVPLSDDEDMVIVKAPADRPGSPAETNLVPASVEEASDEAVADDSRIVTTINVQLSAQAVSSSHEIVTSSDDEDVLIVEAPADRPGFPAETNAVPPSVESLAETAPTSQTIATVNAQLSSQAVSSSHEMVPSDDDEDVVFVEASADRPGSPANANPVPASVESLAETAPSHIATINVQLERASTINLLESKPFGCTICGRKFRTESTMRLHYNIHCRKSPRNPRHRVSPPKCSAHKKGDPRCCGQRSSPESRGCRSRETRFECLICGFSSVDRNALLKHKLHFHRKHFACKLCKRTFRTRFTRFLHTRMHQSVAD